MNRLITSKEIESSIKILPINKALDLMVSWMNSTKHLRRTKPILLKLFQKIQEEVFQIHYEISINMIPKLDKGTAKK